MSAIGSLAHTDPVSRILCRHNGEGQGCNQIVYTETTTGGIMSILSDLYKGGVNPHENIISHNPEYRLLAREVEKGWEKFADYLNEKDKGQFNEWKETVAKYEVQDAYENFVYGFRMGVQLMCAAFLGEYAWDDVDYEKIG